MAVFCITAFEEFHKGLSIKILHCKVQEVMFGDRLNTFPILVGNPVGT
jgi:hypothetical protein